MIKWIIALIIVLVVLGHFGIDIRKVVDSPTAQSNIAYAKKSAEVIWDNYLKDTADVAWSEFKKYVWKPGLEYFEEKFGAESFTTMQLNTGTSTRK